LDHPFSSKHPSAVQITLTSAVRVHFTHLRHHSFSVLMTSLSSSEIKVNYSFRTALLRPLPTPQKQPVKFTFFGLNTLGVTFQQLFSNQKPLFPFLSPLHPHNLTGDKEVNSSYPSGIFHFTNPNSPRKLHPFLLEVERIGFPRYTEPQHSRPTSSPSFSGSEHPPLERLLLYFTFFLGGALGNTPLRWPDGLLTLVTPALFRRFRIILLSPNQADSATLHGAP